MSTRRKGVTVALVLVIAVGLGFGGWRFDSFLNNAAATCMNSGVTVVMHDRGDCVGITDGAYQFDPGSDHPAKQLDDVEAKIKEEDRKVRTDGKPYVSVAYLLPFSVKPKNAVPISSAAEELSGAYAAQLYANNSQQDIEGAGDPQVQLLIENNGTQGAGYRTVDRYIEGDVKSQHLVAVAGIGVSLESTVAEVNALTSFGIPVFGSDVSSDQFSGIQKMVRVTPSNSSVVPALLRYIKSQYRSAFFIYDQHASDSNASDSYVYTLVKDFPNFNGESNKIIQRESYDGSARTVDANARVGQMASDVCTRNVQVVLFAGRGTQLGALLAAFNGTNCVNSENPDKKIAIVTGSDVTNLPLSSEMKNGLNHVDLYYAGEVIPGEWSNDTCVKDAAAIGRADSASFTRTYPFGREEFPVQNGVAMVGYDAMLTATSAIRLAVDNKVGRSPTAVAQELSALQGDHYVPGASGPISFANYGNPHYGSNPSRKVFPILQLLPSGEPKLAQCVQTNP